MSFFTDLYGFLHGMWTALIRRYTTFQLVLIAWAIWIAMPIAINMMWIVITPMWMAITKMWITITSMFMTKSISYDPLDLAFKLWLSIMTFLIFRMGIKYSGQLELRFDRNQQKLDKMHSDLDNFQNSVADCIKYQQEEINLLRQEIKRAQVPSNRIKKLKDALIKLHTLKDSAVKQLKELSDGLDKHYGRIKIVRTAAHAVSISGGLLLITGLVLLPVTFGTSMILSITGGVISGTGGLTASGTMIVDLILSHGDCKSAKKVLNDYNTALEEIKNECYEIGNILDENSIDMKTEYESWCTFWGKLVLGSKTTAVVSWNAIANPIMLSLKISSSAEDAASLAARGVMMAGKAPFIGSILGILMIPLDIYFLVDVAIDVHQKTPHKDSVVFRKLIVELNENCPTDQEIVNMIEATFHPGQLQNIESNA